MGRKEGKGCGEAANPFLQVGSQSAFKMSKKNHIWIFTAILLGF